MLSIEYVHKRVRLFRIELCSLAAALSASFIFCGGFRSYYGLSSAIYIA
jgi:hypothetical protein